MKPLLQHASRSVLDLSSFAQLTQTFSRNVARTPVRPSVCFQCQFRALTLRHSRSRGPYIQRIERTATVHGLRRFSSSPRVLEDRPQFPSPPPLPKPESTGRTLATPPTPTGIPPPPSPQLPPPPSSQSSPHLSSQPRSEPVVERVPEEQLPSHREGQRWKFQKRLFDAMDELMAQFAVVSQKVNNYTGTDYSGIQALRKEIQDQEQLVKARRASVEDAKEALDVAIAQQAASQKEVVGLLERKSSWSAQDLERYMQLIRSEHINEQAVNAAKEAVHDADRALEEARATLERRERAQYHEEQIWSDTIRRNSTWVTFGLMGFNILLLMFSLVIIEPWRRRRLVREVRLALDENSTATAAQLAAAGVEPATASAARPAVEAEIDATVEPAGVAVETLEGKSTTPATAVVAELQSKPDEITTPVALIKEVAPDTEAEVFIPSEPPSKPTDGTWSSLIEYYQACFWDLFSERTVALQQVELTAYTLQAAAAGAAITSLLIVLIRPI